MKTLIISTAIAAVSICASPLAHADKHGKLEAAFKSADKDNDGTLDKEEAKAMPRVSKHFDKLDGDKDGTLTMEEIMAGAGKAKGMHAKGEKMFKSADKDNDGTLDKEEAKAMPKVAENFDAIDGDKDGTVSLDEIHSFMKSRK